MASLRSLSFFGSPAVRALIAAAMITQLSEAQADESTCGNDVSILNNSKIYEAFDKQNGGGGQRLRFRLKGHEPCEASECKLEVITRVASAEKVLATIDLAGRIPSSYCVYELSRIHVTWNRRHLGCPSGYLLNVLGIILIDRDGPFSERRVDVEYMYNGDGGSVSLDRCIWPDIVEVVYPARWHLWRVPLEDGSAVYIGETDSPRNPRAPIPHLLDLPYATSVFGARWE